MIPPQYNGRLCIDFVRTAALINNILELLAYPVMGSGREHMVRDGSKIKLLLHSMRALKALFTILGRVGGRNYHHGAKH